MSITTLLLDLQKDQSCESHLRLLPTSIKAAQISERLPSNPSNPGSTFHLGSATTEET
jgi:hypothetical protein